MQNEECGIRERKRRETKQRIRTEAARLIEEHGYDNVTVDDICRAAGISRRTFFNYMDSKDEAVLGAFPFTFGDEALAAIRNTPADNVLDLVIRSIDVAPGAFDGPSSECRRDLLESNPGLMQAEAARKRGFLTQLGRAIFDHLERYPNDRRHPGSAAEEAHSIIVLFQGAVTRYLWHPPEAADSADADPIDTLRRYAQQLSEYAKDMKW